MSRHNHAPQDTRGPERPLDPERGRSESKDVNDWKNILSGVGGVNHAYGCRVAFRGHGLPYYADCYFGFRAALPPDQ